VIATPSQAKVEREVDKFPRQRESDIAVGKLRASFTTVSAALARRVTTTQLATQPPKRWVRPDEEAAARAKSKSTKAVASKPIATKSRGDASVALRHPTTYPAANHAVVRKRDDEPPGATSDHNHAREENRPKADVTSNIQDSHSTDGESEGSTVSESDDELNDADVTRLANDDANNATGDSSSKSLPKPVWQTQLNPTRAVIPAKQQISKKENSELSIPSLRADERISDLLKQEAGPALGQPITRRATTVPRAVLTDKRDVQSAFARFSNYLEGRSESGSESDSAEDESRKSGDSEADASGESEHGTATSSRQGPKPGSAKVREVQQPAETAIDSEEDAREEDDVDSDKAGKSNDGAVMRYDGALEYDHTPSQPDQVKEVGAHEVAETKGSSFDNLETPEADLSGYEGEDDEDEAEEDDEGKEDDDDEGVNRDSPRPKLPEDSFMVEAPRKALAVAGQPATTPDLVAVSASQASVNAYSMNVGIKRRTSLSGHRRGGSGSLRQPSREPSAVPRPSQDLAFAEDVDVFQTINEVANDIFGSTRPLPARKIDPADHEEHLLTKPASKRKLKALDPEVVDPELPHSGTVRHSSPQVVICASVQIPEVVGEAVVDSFDVSNNVHPVSAAKMGVMPSLRKEPSSSLTELARTPSPPAELLNGPQAHTENDVKDAARDDIKPPSGDVKSEPSSIKKRKMTGMTSKHFTPEKPKKRSRAKVATEPSPAKDTKVAAPSDVHAAVVTHSDFEAITPVSQRTRSAAKGASSRPKRKSTGKKSDHFLPFRDLLDRVDLPTPTRVGRAPAGTSTAPVPPISAARFGIIQEKLWDQPFWLLIAVTFLNKTAGRAAVPTFWALKERYPTPEDLAQADQQDLHDMIRHLGLQTQRSKRLIKISEAWVANPPMACRRYRTLHYPIKEDGKNYKKTEIIEGDAQHCEGALEIGHIPGCGPYAWDSWRIFCRDVLRGVAQDYNGLGAAKDAELEPEWRKVLPLDKELRATLRWMWLRDGWIWNHETGEKRRATEEEMEMAVRGEMEVPDAGELKFAIKATAVTDTEGGGEVPNEVPASSTLLQAMRSDDVGVVDVEETSIWDVPEESDNIVVSPVRSKGRRQSGVATES